MKTPTNAGQASRLPYSSNSLQERSTQAIKREIGATPVLLWLALLLSILNLQLSTSLAAPLGTAFTYQGKVFSGTNAATGLYDFTFALWDAPTLGTPVGGSLLFNAVPVTDGLFTVTLEFGPNVFTGDVCWLEIAVRTNGNPAGFRTLPMRQPLTAVPYALYAPNAGAAAIASSVAAGSIVNAALAANAITSDKIADGTIVDADISASGIDAGKIIGGDLQADRLKVGWEHTLTGAGATIAGGGFNTATNNAATVGGGIYNVAGGGYATVGGGFRNTASGDATVGGGWNNKASGESATVGGGYGNQASGPGAVIAGGGWDDTKGLGNKASGAGSTIGGGLENVAGAKWSTVGGGDANAANGHASFIGGGVGNWTGFYAGVIGGGEANRTMDQYATVAGGCSNRASGWSAVVGGGTYNAACSDDATVSGGYGNAATNTCATIAGGLSNLAYHASATVGGGSYNVADGFGATVPGGSKNVAAGTCSFAAGSHAHASADGCFVWSDASSNFDVWTSGPNQFVAQATGGFWFITAVDGNGVRSCQAYLGPCSPSWSITSDRNQKENFRPVNHRALLEQLAQMPVTEWTMKGEKPGIRHIGPVAQDFHAAFGLGGDDDRQIVSSDETGVALAAIQGLNQKLEEKLERQNAENDELKRRLTHLEQLVSALAQQPKGGNQ